MNKYSVALCYFSDVESGLLGRVRESVSMFGSRTECLVNTLFDPDIFGRNTFRLSRGHDLTVIVTDGAKKHLSFEFLEHFNHVAEDPWAMSVLSLSSPNWKGYQPTIGIEAKRYLGHYFADQLPLNLLEKVQENRQHWYERGLSESEWESIKKH